MQSAPSIIAMARLPVGEAQIVEWRWPSPMDLTVREARHMIEMSLPPLAAEGSACFPDLAPERFVPMGGVFLRPAGVAIRSRSAGGHIQVARLAVEPDAYAALAGRALPSDAPALAAALDLRDALVRMLLARLRDELLSPGFASPALLDAYATALIVETARSLGEARADDAGAQRLAPWQQRRVRDRLAAEGAPPTVSELAALCGIGQRHFARLYRGVTGEPVTTTLARQQVARAMRLLGESDTPLKTIAADLGFAGAGGFAAAFRRATGTSPSQFRQQNRRRPVAVGKA